MFALALFVAIFSILCWLISPSSTPIQEEQYEYEDEDGLTEDFFDELERQWEETQKMMRDSSEIQNPLQ